MKRVWLLVPAGDLEALTEAVRGLKVLHAEPLTAPEEAAGLFGRPEVAEASALEARAALLRHVLAVFDSHAPMKRGFAQNFVALPVEVTREEYDRALKETDAEALERQVRPLAERHAFLMRRQEELGHELALLRPWSGAPAAAPPTFRHVAAWLGVMSQKRWEALVADAEAAALFGLSPLRTAGRKVLVAAVALKEDEAAAGERLRRAGLEPLALPDGDGTVDDRIARLTRDAEETRAELERIQADLTALAGQYRTAVTVCLAEAEMALGGFRAIRGALRSPRIGVLSGYVRAADLPALTEALGGKRGRESFACGPEGCAGQRTGAQTTPDPFFPAVTIVHQDPRPDEQVPVSLKTNPLFTPARFLTRMFGVPDYFGFDPSPFIFTSFILFFGICFGDVLYGLTILALALSLARRLRWNEGLRDFFRLIAWGGAASIIVGALSGSWAGDLLDPEPVYAFVSEGHVLARLRAALMVAEFNMIKRPVQALVVALSLGVLNQFYGLGLRMYREARRLNWAGAFFDAGLWLVFLPGLVILVAGVFAPLPTWLRTAGLALLIAGAVGLVLTQGRNEKTPLAKALAGVLSLYGILGTYGSTSFIGDTVSYSRLLALGLTTTIVGMSFNIIAGLVRDVPVLWVVLVPLVLVVGHLFNVLISLLGAFVHSGRLIFVEFFGRFYDVGGKAFQPLGTSPRVRVVDG